MQKEPAGVPCQPFRREKNPKLKKRYRQNQTANACQRAQPRPLEPDQNQ